MLIVNEYYTSTIFKSTNIILRSSLYLKMSQTILRRKHFTSSIINLKCSQKALKVDKKAWLNVKLL